MRTYLALCALSLILALSGCARSIMPVVKVYDDASIPLSETAVISINPSRDANLTGGAASIEAINGKHPPCVTPNCPIWFRVLPGTYDAEILLKDFSLSGVIVPIPGAVLVGINEKRATFLVNVSAKVGHTYYFTQRIVDGHLRYMVDDVGIGKDPELNRR
jgi:hypothetical protein